LGTEYELIKEFKLHNVLHLLASEVGQQDYLICDAVRQIFSVDIFTMLCYNVFVVKGREKALNKK